MGKKILICEDNKGTADFLAYFFEKKGLEAIVLLRNTSQEVVNDTEQVVRDTQPDYVVVDGLDGSCLEVIDKVRKVKPDIVSAVFSGDESLVEGVKGKGYEAFNKPDGLDNLWKYFSERA